MKIAAFSHYFVPEVGAPSARVFDMARQWVETGHEVQVVTCLPNHPQGQIYPGYHKNRHMNEDMAGIKVHRHLTYITANRGFIKKTLSHVSFWPSARIFSTPRLGSVDVTIGTSPTFFAAMAAADAAKRNRAPFIMEVRDLWPDIFVDLGVITNQRIIKLLRLWEMSLYKRAARVVTVTESFRASLLERGLPPDKVHTITNGADIDFWTPRSPQPETAASLGLSGCFVVLYLGTHGISQRLSQVVEAAKSLQNRTDIKFLLVGAGAEKAALQQQAREARLENLVFHDPVDKEQVREMYAMADAALVPLRDIPLFDAFIPSKLFEVMAVGKPVIGCLRGEAADILRRSKGGMLVKPEDCHALAAVVRELADDPGRCRELGCRGRKFVEKNYSREMLATRYETLMEQVIAEHRELVR